MPAELTNGTRTSPIPQLGVIESIELADFMCHEYLRVELGSKINFIIGHNGSGKSAILTAIIICLGGKATATQRATSVKLLIREGAPRATITMRLRNRGRDAYQPDVYGDCITIERILIRDSGGGYRLRSGLTDRVVSTRRDDLLAICDHMAIQVDNPLNVLSQDLSRQFLNSTTPEEKYRFFLKGTQLAQLKMDHQILQEGLQTTDAIVTRKRDLLPDLLKEAKEWERRYKDMQNARDLALKLDDLKKEMAWAHVEQKEHFHHGAQQRVRRAQRKLSQIDEKIEEERARLNDLDARLKQVDQETAQFRSQKEILAAQHADMLGNQRQIKDAMADLQSDEHDMNQEIQGLRKRERELTQSIEQEQRTTQVDIQRQRDQKQEEIQECKDRQEALAQQKGEIQAEGKTLEVDLHKHRERERQLQEQRRSMKQKIQQGQQRLAQIKRRKEDQLTAFGPTIPDVLQSIAAETRWRAGPPLGPLGRYVKLTQSKWAETLESVLNWALNAFVVQCHEDHRILSEICRHHKCRSRIVVSKLEPFDYSAGEPDPVYLTILRALRFEHDAVKYQLINSHRAEQTLLVEQRAEADRVMTSHNGGFPPNVAACFTVDGFQVGRRGGLATMAVNRYRGPPRFTVDVDALIHTEEQQLTTWREELRALESENRQLQDEERLMQRKGQAQHRSLRDLDTEAHDLRLKLDRLQEELQDLEPVNLAALNAELKNIESKTDLIKRQFATVHQQLMTKTQELEALQHLETDLARQIDQIRDELVKLRTQASAAEDKRIQQEGRIQQWNQKREDAQNRLEAAQEEVRQLTTELEEEMTKATQYCPERVSVTHEPIQLDQEMRVIEQRLKETERIHGNDLEGIAQQAQKSIEAYHRAKTDILAMGTFVNELRQALEVRQTKWDRFRESIAVRAKANFLWYLAQRGYTGQLEVDHQAQRLNPRVQTEDPALVAASTEARSGKSNGALDKLQRDKDPKSLSGGEKSFSTICLLLALWESMGCPIRCLDEFDVFMDAVNRRISMSLMIESARQAVDTQYILITPQDMSSVSFGPDVRVHRLADPDRRRVT
ncbi:Structural maintenance of chromosomes protein 6 [Dispira simplex]|nr:Structural maintenance of chromosomes protein 6 [Dispira simplex]